MKKLKVGDKVTVREDLVIGTKYYGGQIFVNGMEKLKGKEVTISKVEGDGIYRIAEERYNWTTEMFREKKETVKIEIGVMREEIKEKLNIKELEDVDNWSLLQEVKRRGLKIENTLTEKIEEVIDELDGAENLINYLVKDMGELYPYQVLMAISDDENIGEILSNVVESGHIKEDEIIVGINNLDYSQGAMESFVGANVETVTEALKTEGYIVAENEDDLFHDYKEEILYYISERI